ncbi:TonB-dependent receptor [Hymenobacter sp. 5317J-9]|uniref:SusC/RagA family TonB-linked outer membrane protein n=1 Tax=Hymenobacter sp. 5317J-9 TaxID=2932250 RepID=UPI001FD6EB16|nr:TonB-dependent receptor [Hymenobacter sp. 5317J-9]UOQ99286.1 TonB-dependent receptor [Hymenobacter sp. 5317J-9]
MSALLVLLGHDLRAQDRNLTGTVIGSDGASIPGVTVLVKGTKLGTSTDADGKFTVSAPASASTLVFSYVGYATQEVAIGGQSSFNIRLATDTKDLSEVVVVGYGTQSRRDLTGSVATITGKEIATAPVQSFDQALQGRAPGVNITTPNGVLNNPPVIRIRGVNSINLSSSPLIVIDGVPAFTGNNSALGSVPNNPLSNLNPADIESMEVLKDASATAIYGSRAAGGVILVTTKKGRKGQSHLSYDTWAGWSKPVRLYDVLNAQQYVDVKNEAVRNLNANRRAIGAAATNVEGFKLADANGNAADTRWYDYIYRTGFSQSHNLNFSGGTDKTSFFSSVGYTNQKGMIVNNDFKRLSARLNVDHKLYKNFTVGMRVAYSNTQNASPNTGSVGDNAFGSAGLGRVPILLPPNLAAYNPDGSPNVSGTSIGPGPNLNPTNGQPFVIGFINPVVDIKNNYFTSEGSQIEGSVYADWEIISGLNLRTSYGLNNLSFEDKAFYTSLPGSLTPTGEADNYFRTNKRWNWQNTLQYDHSFAEKHNLSLLVGNEQQNTDIQRWGASRTGVADDFFTTFQGNYTNIASSGQFQGTNYLVSFFGRVNYNYDHKYLASASVRRDGYSAFAKKYGNFYGASLGYVVSEEAFWKNASFSNVFSTLKLTGSYGMVGNNQGIADFVALSTYTSGLYAANPTLYYGNAGNQNLTWETSKKTDIGLSFGFFQDRLRGNAAYYENLVDGLILDVPQSPSKGIPNNSIQANVGSMRNTGIEVDLSYNVLQGKAFSWTVSGNVTTLKNRVLSLATEGQRIGTSTGGLETSNYTQVGHSVGEILAVRSLGVNPDNGRRMIRKADGTVVEYNHQGTSGVGSTGWTIKGTNTNTSAPTQLQDGEYFGPVLPTWYGGFDNTFRYKGIDLGLFVQFSGGNYIYNGTKSGLHDQRFWNNEVDILNHWTESNRDAKWPRVVYGDNVSNGSALVMSSNVEKGDFARLRQVSLGYSFDQGLLTRLGVANARLYVQVQNALLFTKYSGIDPEISSNGTSTVAAGANTGAGVDRNSVGQARTYTVGFNIGF